MNRDRLYYDSVELAEDYETQLYKWDLVMNDAWNALDVETIDILQDKAETMLEEIETHITYYYELDFIPSDLETAKNSCEMMIEDLKDIRKDILDSWEDERAALDEIKEKSAR